MKLDYTIDDPIKRKELVEQIIAEATPDQLTPQYLEVLADYLIFCMEKQEKKEKRIISENRRTTIDKRERSLEGLTEEMDDALMPLITNDRNVIFQPKVTITKEDLEEVPFLPQVREAINIWHSKLHTASGRDAYIIKHTIIDLQKDQYIIKNAYRRPIVFQKLARTHVRNHIPLEDTTSDFDENGFPIPTGVSFLDPQVVRGIFSNYQKLKQDGEGDFEGDIWYLMEDFNHLIQPLLDSNPVYRIIFEGKTTGLSNQEIQTEIQQTTGLSYSPEYISNLWRSKIPHLVAMAAEDQYLNWYYFSQAKGTYKRCTKCGQVKLAHRKYFSLNGSSKDGYYSICKECRRSKRRDK